MTKNQIIFALVGLIHLATATELQECIRALSREEEAGDSLPPLGYGDNTCRRFTFLYGPTSRWCDWRKSAYNDGVGIRGGDGSTVTAMFPFSNGEIIEIGEKTLLGDPAPYILVRHTFTQDDCWFNGDRVTGIFIDYISVKADDSLYVGYKYPQDSANLPLGKLVHKKDCLCGGNLKGSFRTGIHPHLSLVLRLHVEYESGEKSHTIPPAFLFKYWRDSVTFFLGNLNKFSTSNERFFHLGTDARIVINGRGCQTHYNEFHLKCEDTTSGEGIEGQYEHTIKLDDPEKTQRRFDTDYTSHNPHFIGQGYDHSGFSFWLPYILPGGVQEKMWDGVHQSCSIQCKLSVYDVAGNSIGRVSFSGASRENCPNGPVIATAPQYDPESFDLPECDEQADMEVRSLVVRPLTFRAAEYMWDGKWSYEYEIGVSGGGWNKVHKELTSRAIHDGETFIIEGNREQVGVGLCIESCELEGDFGIRWKHNCVGFYGDGATHMFATDESGTEYYIPAERPRSTKQGFTYNQVNNCVTHIGSATGTCTNLPDHFEGKVVRAVAQVWNSASARIY